MAPYCCNMCPKTSADKGALIRHMRTHNGERPYECGECQYAFTTKANCERHLRNRHGKVNRDELRNCIIYHLNEDSSLNKSLDDSAGSISVATERKSSAPVLQHQQASAAPFFGRNMADLTRNLLLDFSTDDRQAAYGSPKRLVN